MKRNLWLILAAAALLGMFFAPRSAYSMELGVPSLPGVPAIPTLPTPTLPAVPLPDVLRRVPPSPIFPGRDIRLPVELPSRRIPGPVLPIPIQLKPCARVSGVLASTRKLMADSQAGSQAAAPAARLDKAYDNARVSVADDAPVVVVPQARRKRRLGDPSHLTLPESDLESEIGIR